MKRKLSKLVVFIFCLGFFVPTTFGVAKEKIRTQDLAEVEKGKIEQATVLSSEAGEVYLEFLNNTLVLKNNGKVSFEGQILAPTVIPLPSRPPRSRMQEIISFELIGSTNEKLFFGDKFNILTEKNKYRLQYYDPEQFQRTAQVRALIPLSTKINYATLYQYDEETNEWTILGGKIGDGITNEIASEEEIAPQDPPVEIEESEHIFVGQIKSTGIFTLFNDDPDPSFVAPFPLDQIQVVEAGPGDFKNGACFTCNNKNINEAGLYGYEEGAYDPFQDEYTGDPVTGKNENVFSGDVVPAVIGPEDTDSIYKETESGTKKNSPTKKITIYATDIVCEEGTIFTPGEYDPYEQNYTGDQLKGTGKPAFLETTNPNPLTEEEINSLPSTCKIVMKDRTPQKIEIPEGPLSKTGKEELSMTPFYVLGFLGMMGTAIFLGLRKKKNY